MATALPPASSRLGVGTGADVEPEGDGVVVETEVSGEVSADVPASLPPRGALSHAPTDCYTLLLQFTNILKLFIYYFSKY